MSELVSSVCGELAGLLVPLLVWCGAGKNQGLKAFCIDPRILCPPPLHRTFAPLAPALASTSTAHSQPLELNLGGKIPCAEWRGEWSPACLLIDSDGSRYANGRRHFLCDTGARVGTRPIRTFFLAAWVGLGGTWLVHCVAKTVVLNSRSVSMKMDVYDKDIPCIYVHLIFVPWFPVCCVVCLWVSLSIKFKCRRSPQQL